MPIRPISVVYCLLSLALVPLSARLVGAQAEPDTIARIAPGAALRMMVAAQLDEHHQPLGELMSTPATFIRFDRPMLRLRYAQRDSAIDIARVVHMEVLVGQHSLAARNAK